MNVSTPVKIFALLALLAAVVLGGGMMFLAPGAEAEATDPVVIPTKKGGLLATPAKAKKVAAKASAAAESKAPAVAKPKTAAAAAKPKPAAKPKQAPAEVRGVATNGLPMQIAVALRRENVVVVALFGTGGKIDELARAEAEAGAAAVGAGFVALNVIDRSREAEALTLKLNEVLRAPTVLFFTGEGELTLRLDGFRDRETVAQAALNALR